MRPAGIYSDNNMKAQRKKIICGTDFSSNAIRAATSAATLAAKLKEPLVLAHIMELPATELIGRDFVAEAQARGKARLKEEADRLRALGARVEEYFTIGSPYETLVNVAKENNARMIIMASSKRSAAERWFIGSVADRVAQSSSFPVFVVRDPAVLEEWAAGTRPLNIFVAASLGHSSDAALLWLRDLIKAGPCNITAGYLNWIPESNSRIGVTGPISLVENTQEVQAILERDLQDKVEKLLGTREVKLAVEPAWGRIDSRLVEMAQREQADLIVVGTHQHQGAKRLFAESVSRGVLHEASVNVAIVPGAAIGPAEAPIIPTRRVLVSTDFSEIGNHAILSAYSILSCGGKVCLVHVVEPFELPNPLIANYKPTHKNKRQHKAHVEKLLKDLQQLIPSQAESLGIETEVQVVENHNPAVGICHAAERFGADVICIASHGRSGISKALLGSVATKVLSRSERPVLIVRPGKE